jgi:hypothetical protein
MLVLRLLVSLLLLSIAVPLLQAEPLFSFENTPCCLPKTVRPITYTMNLKPDAYKPSHAGYEGYIDFQGQKEIDIEFLQPANTITLNANAWIERQ